MRTIEGLGLSKHAVIGALLAGLLVLSSCSRHKTVSSQNYGLKQSFSVLNIKPTAIPVRKSGVQVAISGTGFKLGVSVYIGDTFCSNLQFVSPSELACTAPPSAQVGTVTVKVVNPDNEVSTLQNGFRYLAITTTPPEQQPDPEDPPKSEEPAPVVHIAKVVPDSGPATGGTRVRILGSFPYSEELLLEHPRSGGLTVMFGAGFCTGIILESSSSLECATPASPGGPVNVTVSTHDNKASHVVARAFSYTPSITSLAPQEGPSTGGTVLALSGFGFENVAQVTVGVNYCKILSKQSTMVQCVVPPGIPGTSVPVTVYNYDGLMVTFSKLFFYKRASDVIPPPAPPAPVPTISRIEPNQGPIDVGTRATIHGANFRPGVKVYFNEKPCVIYSAATSTIDCLVPPGTGPKTLRVINPDNTTATMDSAFVHVPPPELKLFVNAQASDITIGVHEALTVSWNSNYTTYCDVTNENGNSDKWVARAHPGVGVGIGTYLSERQVRYRLSCVGPGGQTNISRLVSRYIFTVGGPNYGAYLLRNSADVQTCLRAARPSCTVRPNAAQWGTANALKYPNPSSSGPVRFMNNPAQCRCFNTAAITYWTTNRVP